MSTYNRAPKILVYGGSGVGKSWGTLTMPCDKYIIDVEGGCAPYRERYPYQGEEGIVNNYFVARDLVRNVMENPGTARLLGIDPISMIWQMLSLDFDDQIRFDMKKGKVSRKDPGVYYSAMDQGMWVACKNWWMKLMADISRMNLMVIATAWEKQAEPGGPWPFEPVGPKEMRYPWDVVLRASVVGGKRVTFVDKDRPMEASPHMEEMPWNEYVKKNYGSWFGHVSEAMPRPTDEMQDEYRTLVANTGFKPEQIIAALRKRGADKFEDLTVAAAEEVLASLRSKVAKPLAS